MDKPDGPRSDAPERLDDVHVAAEAVRELAQRLKLFTREREELLAAERAARTQAEQAMRQKDDFLATLSHELRTPIANVLNWTHVLQTRFGELDPLLQKGLRVIADNTSAQARLIADLLDVSRINAGKIALELKPTNLFELINAAVTAQRPSAEAQGVELAIQFTGEPAVTSADPVRLQQVLWNLLSNALKFTPAGGRIEVGVAATDAICEISVKDSGEGLDPEFLPHVFERFAQAEGVSRRTGLGLGLALVKQLAELHGGEVSAHSGGAGQGCTFIVTLPIRRSESHAPAAAKTSWTVDPEAMQPRGLAGLRVLAVDDQPAMLEHLARTLREHGADVIAVPSGAEVLNRLPTPDVDVLVSDIGMPNMDGFELLRHVRSRMGPSFPVVAVTAFAREEDRARILSAGFDAHIAKPIETAQLVTAVRELAQQRRIDAPPRESGHPGKFV